MTISELIRLQSAKLGDKLVEAVNKGDAGVQTIVEIMDQHQAESMMEAYALGLREKKDLVVLKKGK